MKKTLIFSLAILFAGLAYAQAPHRMAYQAVIRNAANNPVVSAPVKVRISILQGSISGSSVYSEIHNPTTNGQGVVNLEIGGGANPSGSFSDIDWSKGSYFIKTETDPANGTNYSISGTTQLLSVPYALHANCVSSTLSATGDTLTVGCKTYVIPGIKDVTPPSTIRSGLVGYWPFNGNANDESGNGNNGVVSGATLSADRKGKANSAYRFNGFGSNNHIKVMNSNTLKFSEMSISIWYKIKSPAGMSGNGGLTDFGNHALFSKEGDGIGTPGGFFGEMYFTPTNGYLGYYNSNGCCDARKKQDSLAAYSHVSAVSDTSWHHAVFIATNKDFKIYLDGTLVKTKALIQDFSAANNLNLYFGIYGNGGASQPSWYPFNGQLDDIRIYNRALNAEEITYLSKQ